MRVVRGGEAERAQGPAERFEGRVLLERLLVHRDDVSLSVVRFHDGARTNWHTHDEEQVLYVIEGECRLGTDAIPEERLLPGDRAHLPPGERHWHGAAPGATMAHLSITTGAEPVWDGPPPSR